MSHDDRDLAPLDPERDPLQWERMVGSIMTAAGPSLQQRARSPILLLRDWSRPTLAAAATVAILAGSALFGGELTLEEASETGVVAEGIGLPTSIATWLDTGSSAALDDLVFAMEAETP